MLCFTFLTDADWWCAHFLFPFFFIKLFTCAFFMLPPKRCDLGLGATQTGGKCKAVKKICLSPVCNCCALKITILSTKDCDLCLCSVISESSFLLIGRWLPNTKRRRRIPCCSQFRSQEKDSGLLLTLALSPVDWAMGLLSLGYRRLNGGLYCLKEALLLTLALSPVDWAMVLLSLGYGVIIIWMEGYIVWRKLCYWR